MRPTDIQPDYELQQQVRLENDAVRAVMEACKLPKQSRIKVYETAKALKSTLSPSVWETAFPNFPFLFVVQREARLKDFGKLQTFWTKRSRRVEISRLTQVVESHLAASPNCLVGVLVRLPYVDGWSIMHTGLSPESEKLGVSLTFAAEQHPPYTAHSHVEPLEQFTERHAELIAGYFSESGQQWIG